MINLKKILLEKFELGKIQTNQHRAFAIVNESDDDKYSHIGYGKYKVKGTENDSNAIVFTKDDNGKYIRGKSTNSDEPTKPVVNIFDEPKKTEPKPSKPSTTDTTSKLDTKSFDNFDKMLNMEGVGFNAGMANNWFGRYDSQIQKFDKSQMKSLDQYRDLHYNAINKLERGTVPQSWKDKNKKKVLELKKISDTISSSIKNTKTTEDIISYRGVDGSRDEKVAQFFNNLKPGDEYQDTGFSSTSINKSIVEGKFSATKGKGANIKILIPKGSSALPMQNIGSTSTKQMYDDEFEVLLDKGSKFKVISRKGINITVMLIQ